MNLKKILIIAIPVIVAASIGVLFSQNLDSEPDVLKAAIIDQLYHDVPNSYFHKKAIEYLKDAGYQVDLYITENTTVDLFQTLPSKNYQFIVMRTHALEASSEDNSVLLFTGERYTDEKYISDQILGNLKKGAPLLDRTFAIDENKTSEWVQVNSTTRMRTSPVLIIDEPREDYFLIPPQMVTNVMSGKFPDTIIVLGGCSTLANPTMAQSFIKKGASSVIGWDNLVSSSDNDRALLKLLENIFEKKMDSKDAVDEIMKDWRPNPRYNATLQYYS